MARIEISHGEYLRSVDAATTSEVLPYDFSYPFIINYVVMDHNGPVDLNYSGRGSLSSRPNEETDLLVLGDPYMGSRLEAYRVAKEATSASLERIALVTSGLEAGWAGKRKKSGATADWVEAFEYARKAKKAWAKGVLDYRR